MLDVVLLTENTKLWKLCYWNVTWPTQNKLLAWLTSFSAKYNATTEPMVCVGNQGDNHKDNVLKDEENRRFCVLNVFIFT